MRQADRLCGMMRQPGTCLIMGIVNATPDSFYAPSRADGASEALARARSLVEAGADIIDIGGESTRPGALPVPVDEESRRVLPAVEACAQELAVPISIDTRHALVAERALALGASIVNDISALSDPEMPRLVSSSGAIAILMHMQGRPETMQDAPRYGDVLDDVEGFFRARIESALAAGVSPDKLWLDPGIGFGKRLRDNLALIAALPRFAGLGHPLVAGFSRKSFITKALIHKALASPAGRARRAGRETLAEDDVGRDPDFRRERKAEFPSGGDTLLATCLYNFAALEGGARVLRVHDAREAAITRRVWRSLAEEF